VSYVEKEGKLCHGWGGNAKKWGRSYLFGARNTARVVDSHFPLVQGCDSECGLALCLWNARLFVIDDGASREFKEPR